MQRHLKTIFFSIGSADKQTTTQNKEYISYLCDKLNTKLVFNAITEESVLHIINSLKPKTSTGVDGISNKLLKSVKCGIAKPLTIIINQMLSVGIFPDLLKISKVILLYKKDDPVTFLIIDQYHFYLQYLKYLKRPFLNNWQII